MATINDSILVINVPSDIGSMIKGKHLTPAAFKSVDFVKKLEGSGYKVEEVEALSEPAIWSSESTFEPNGVRNEEANVEVNQKVKAAVTDGIKSASRFPFQVVVGGECNIVPAILSAYWAKLAPKRIGLLYVDGDADLGIPGEPGSSGNLASMSFTHLTLRQGSLKSMYQFSKPDGSGVCDPGNSVIFGLNSAIQGNTRSQMGHLFDEGYRVITSSAVAKDPESRAREALSWLEERVDYIFVHLDVDAIDGGSFPLANVVNRTGADFDKIMAAMSVFLDSKKACGLCIAEVNPDHDPKLKMTTRLVDTLVEQLQSRLHKS